MSDEAMPRPSARAVERFADDVGSEVDDLRSRLHRALDEADRLEAVGRQDLAAAVLDEQRVVLLAVHDRLQERLAGAAVEREAERVLDAASAASAPEPEPAPVAPLSGSAAVGGDSGVLRLLASAVAAVLGIALLVTPELTGGALTAAGSAPAERGPDQEDADAPAGQPRQEPPVTPRGPQREQHGAAPEGAPAPPPRLPDAGPGDEHGSATPPGEDTTGSEPAPWLSELAPLPATPTLPANDGRGETRDDGRDGTEDDAEPDAGRADDSAGADDSTDDGTDAPEADGADGSGGEPSGTTPAAVVPVPTGDVAGADGEADRAER